jgi:hypothetical protein
MTDPITERLVKNIGCARGTDYFLMKEQLKPEEVEIHIGSGASFPSSWSPRSRR